RHRHHRAVDLVQRRGRRPARRARPPRRGRAGGGGPGVSEAAATDPLLRVEGLTVTRPRGGRTLTLVEDVSFELDAGRTLSLVGESGSGKTLTALSVINHLPAPLRLAAGRVAFGGRDLTALSPAELRTIRGRDIGIV